MVSLLDINVLVALAWPNHVHHRAALAWFQKHQASGWATSPVTQSGFIRVSSNRAIIPEARSPLEAILLLRRIVALEHHEFWHDDVAFVSPAFDEVPLVGHRQVTDAHLLMLAQHRGGRLATLDGRIRTLVPQGRVASDVLCFVLGE